MSSELPDRSPPDGVGSQPSTQSGFACLLVACAVFPLALGIGTILQTAPPTPPVIAAEQHTPVPNQIPVAPRRPPTRAEGDERVQERRFESALLIYQSLGSADPARLPPELSLRIALCQEELGHWEQARDIYQGLASTHSGTPAALGLLGQARLAYRLAEPGTAEPLLRTLLRQSSLLPTEARSEAAWLYGLCLAELTAPEPDPSGSAINPIEWSRGRELTWWDAPAARDAAHHANRLLCEFPDDSAGDPANPADALAPSNQVPLAQGLAARVHAFAQGLSANSVLNRLTAELGVSVSGTEPGTPDTPPLDLALEGLPFSLVLTVLARERSATWSADESTRSLTVVTCGTESRPGSAVTRAVLLDLLRWDTHHPLSRNGQFVLARLDAREGQYDAAEKRYLSLVGQSATPLAVHAAYNAALAARSRADLSAASRALERVVYGAPGHQLHAAALLLYGRTLLELGEFREAAFQLKRATNPSSPPSVRGRAGVFLAMALLLDGEPRQAAESLFTNRAHFHEPTVRNAAALLTALSRWRTTQGAVQDRESAFLYRAIVGVQREAEWLGPMGQVVIGQALYEARLEDQMAELYQAAVRQGGSPKAVRQMKLALADYWRDHAQREAARLIWTELSDGPAPESLSASLRLAELALDEGQPGRCLELCYSLQHVERAPRSNLQKLAGRAYEMANQPVQAAQCYAGMWPLP